MHCAKLHVGILVPLVPVVALFRLAALGLGQQTVSHDEPGWAANYADALTAYITRGITIRRARHWNRAGIRRSPGQQAPSLRCGRGSRVRL
jgi:hypothetical protein